MFNPSFLPPNNTPQDSLEPVLSKKAVELHWGEHYQAHVKALNERLREEPELAKLPLEELVKKAYRHGNPLMLFNDAAEVGGRKVLRGVLGFGI